MLRNIIFDWSGTLVDDLPAVWRATNYVLTRAERTEPTPDQFRAEFCLPFTLFYERHAPHVPLLELEGWFHGHFREVQHTVMPLPHAQAFLEFCRARRLKTFLLSTVHPDHYAIQAEVTGFGKYLDAKYVGVWDKRRKIHEILKEHSMDPRETLFIGDMQHDIETAKHGGIHSCAVLTGYNTLDQLRTASPDVIVEHLGELRDLLERNEMHLQRPTSFESTHPPIVTVGALIFNRAGQVLMVRTHKWSNLWGIPGGKIKWGEPAETALRREIQEETALAIEDVKFVMVQDCIHSKEFYRDAHFVLLNYTCVAQPGTVKLNEEAREFRWTSLEEALTMTLNQPTRTLLIEVARRPDRPVKNHGD